MAAGERQGLPEWQALQGKPALCWLAVRDGETRKSLFFHAMPDEMTSEVGECNSHCLKPEQNGINCCPHIVLVWHLEDIAHNDLIID
jgi:hypothetical protein